MAEIEDLHPNLSTDLSECLHSENLFGLRHNSSLICYFTKNISILETIGPNILNANF